MESNVLKLLLSGAWQSHSEREIFDSLKYFHYSYYREAQIAHHKTVVFPINVACFSQLRVRRGRHLVGKERDGVIYVMDVIEEVTLFHHHHHHNFVSLKGDQ